MLQHYVYQNISKPKGCMQQTFFSCTLCIHIYIRQSVDGHLSFIFPLCLTIKNKLLPEYNLCDNNITRLFIFTQSSTIYLLKIAQCHKAQKVSEILLWHYKSMLHIYFIFPGVTMVILYDILSTRLFHSMIMNF